MSDNDEDSNAPNYPEDLLKNLEETRLPADLKAQILAELPPPEEMERLYREMQENGGLSFEEFFEPLLREFEEQPRAS